MNYWLTCVNPASKMGLVTLGETASPSGSFSNVLWSIVCAVTQLHSVEIVCWVVENLCPFDIVKDHAFQCLMKTG